MTADLDGLIAFLRARIDEDQAGADARARNPLEGMSDDQLHWHRAHPAYEYETTAGPRKAWDSVDTPPWDDELHRPGDGWELNITSADPYAWERFDYTEERRWRRPHPDGPRQWHPSAAAARALADVEAKRQHLDWLLHARGIAENTRRSALIQGDAFIFAEGVIEKSIMMLALPYAGHSDYREEWRP